MMSHLFSPMLRILLFAVLLMAGIGAAQAKPVFPPGLRVGLEPADALKPGPGISGFQDPDRKVTVAIAELPVEAYAELMRAMFGPAPAGATDVERRLFAFKEGVGYLHEASTIENGVATRHWVFLAMPAGIEQPFVALINVTVPRSASMIYSDAAVQKMLASMTIRDPPIEEQLGLIPFKLTDLAGFQVKRVTPNSVLIADGPASDLSQTAYMVVSIGRAPPAQMDDPARFSRDLLATAPIRNLTLQSAEKMRIGGTPGFEIRARGQGPHNNNLSMVQWVRFTGGGFIRMIAVTPTEQWADTFNRFRAVRDGMTFR
jgi:hypothetical protein